MTELIDHAFNIGDKVITTFGEVGKIVDICKCRSCEIRGFYEPEWVDQFGEKHYITIWDWKNNFSEFYSIGKYKFNKLFNKEFISREIADCEDRLADFKNRLAVIKKIEENELVDDILGG